MPLLSSTIMSLDALEGGIWASSFMVEGGDEDIVGRRQVSGNKTKLNNREMSSEQSFFFFFSSSNQKKLYWYVYWKKNSDWREQLYLGPIIANIYIYTNLY